MITFESLYYYYYYYMIYIAPISKIELEATQTVHFWIAGTSPGDMGQVHI